jgi:hypothetical protein
MRASYGGAFLCSSAFFRSIQFTLDRNLPTEAAAGFDAFRVPGARALKTRNVFDFFVLHLSGWEFYERLTPPDGAGDDWCCVAIPMARNDPARCALDGTV